MKVYPVSEVKCSIKIRMRREKLNGEYINDVFPFEREIFIVMDGTDMDKVFNTIQQQIFESVEKFMKNGSGWSVLNLERFDNNVYEYKPFAGSTYIKFKDITVKFEGREIDLDSELSGRKAIINMQNDDNECFKWSIVCAFNPVKDNPQQITKELRKQAEQHDWNKIPFPTPDGDRSVNKFEKKNNISINVYGFRWEYNRKLEEMEHIPSAFALHCISRVPDYQPEPIVRVKTKPDENMVKEFLDTITSWVHKIHEEF